MIHASSGESAVGVRESARAQVRTVGVNLDNWRESEQGFDEIDRSRTRWSSQVSRPTIGEPHHRSHGIGHIAAPEPIRSWTRNCPKHDLEIGHTVADRRPSLRVFDASVTEGAFWLTSHVGRAGGTPPMWWTVSRVHTLHSPSPIADADGRASSSDLPPAQADLGLTLADPRPGGIGDARRPTIDRQNDKPGLLAAEWLSVGSEVPGAADSAELDQPTSSTTHGNPGAFATRRSAVTNGRSSRTASAT